MVWAKDMKIHQQMAVSKIERGTITIIWVLFSGLSVCAAKAEEQSLDLAIILAFSSLYMGPFSSLRRHQAEPTFPSACATP